MTITPRSLVPVAVVATSLLMLSACGAPPGHTGTAADPVTLSSTWGNGAGGIGADVLDALVHPEADSPVTVSAPFSSPDVDPADEEGAAIDVLAAGDADISVIRADRLVEAGADSLAPLQAPLVVTNNEQAAAIAADPVADDLMSGLADIGLVGIALAPGGLRHTWGYQGAVVSLDDFAGAVINTRRGPGADALFAALGATTDHSVGDTRTAASHDGTLTGIETSLQQYQAVDRPAILTSNVTLYEKFDVVVIRADAYASLSPGQRDELAARVDEAIAGATEARNDEASGFAEWCGVSGASAVMAGADEVAALAAALESVVVDLEADSDAKAAIARMRELRVGTTDTVLGTCDDPTAGTTDSDFLVEPVGDQTVLDGMWRAEVTAEEFEAAGSNFHDAQANAGVWTFDIDGGATAIDQPNGPDCEGTFAFDGNRISLDWSTPSNDHCFGLSAGTFSRDGDVVHITWETQRDYNVALDNALFANGLVLVG